MALILNGPHRGQHADPRLAFAIRSHLSDRIFPASIYRRCLYRRSRGRGSCFVFVHHEERPA